MPMRYLLTLACALLISTHVQALAQDDPLQKRLNQAIAEYNEAVQDETTKLKEVIDERIEDAQKKGDLDLKRTYQDAHDALEKGDVPTLERLKASIKQMNTVLARAKKSLLAAYSDVEKRYVQDGKDDRAQMTRDERLQLEKELPEGRIAPATRAKKEAKANRDAAVWVLKQRGSVSVQLLGGAKVNKIKNVANLPPDPFKVLDVDLTGNRNLNRDNCKVLAELTDLETLSVGASNFSDNALECIQQLRKLKSLNLNFTEVTGNGLATLEIQKIETLDMTAMKQPEAALRYLHEKGSIEWLNLGALMMTDDMMELLGRIKSLKTVWFKEGRVTNQQVEKLKKANPKVRVLLHPAG